MKNPPLDDRGEGPAASTADDHAGSENAVAQDALGVPPIPSRRGVWRFSAKSEPAADGAQGDRSEAQQPLQLADDAIAPESNLPVVPVEPAQVDLVAAPPEYVPLAADPVVAVVDLPAPSEAPEDVNTIKAYDFTPRPDLLPSGRNPNPFSETSTWFDRWGFRSLVVTAAGGLVGLAIAWGMQHGWTDGDANSVAASGNEAQVAAVVQPAPPPPIEAPAPVIVPPVSEADSPTVPPIQEVAPAAPIPPLVTVQPGEFGKEPPVMEDPVPEEPVKPVAKPEPVRKLAANPQRVAKVAAKAQPVRKVTAKAQPPRKVAAKVQPSRKGAAKPAPKTVAAKKVERKPARVVAEAAAPVRKPVKPRVPPKAVAAAAPVSTRADLLKACRGYGYNAERCIQRGCKLTKFGLACPGKK